jgi:8-oxo-dGTP pyrophosphatase MutT (NUDIX family)
VTSTSVPPTTETEAVPVRNAATVMIIRNAEDGQPGIEVFMLRRTLKAMFASGMYVFPGGRVDAADGDDLEQAHRTAAIRECFEEAGVLLAHTPGTFATITDGHPALAHREGVHDGSIDLLALCAEHGLEPATEQLVWVAHWITPKGEGARRFDTRFYLVPAPAGQTSVHDDNETIASLWTRPSVALERQEAGELMMMPPTITNLQFLAPFSTVDDAMAAAHELPTPPPCILPKIRLAADGSIAGVSMPGDDDYDSLD